MKYALILLFCFTSLTAYSGGTLELKGKIQKIENGIVHMITEEGDIKISAKKLSKNDNQIVNEAIATKKVITLRVSPIALKR